MKKVLMTLTLLCAFFSVVTVNAATKEEINLKDLTKDSMIIGYRLYDTDYFMSVYDIVTAASEYAIETDEQPSIYVYAVNIDNPEEGRLYEYGAEELPEDRTEDIDEIFPGLKAEITHVNNADYDKTEEKIETMLDERIDAAAKELDKTAESFGFESIEYDSETKTGTFKIKNLKGDLAAYRESEIVKLFLGFIESSDYIAKTVTYEIRNAEDELEDKTVDLSVLTDKKVISLAKELLETMADKDAALIYESVANRSKTATFVVVCDGFEYEFDFTVEFKYDVKSLKDAAIEEAAKALNTEAKANGFESIEYKVETKGDVTTRTGVFTIANLKGDLAAYRESGIVAFFMDIVDGAKSVTYKVRNEEGAIVDKTVSLETLTDKKVISMAKEVLEAMADKDAALVYESVANRSTTAIFVYEVNGEEYAVEYTLSFVYDVKNIKDAEISEAAKALNSEAKANGFESIEYKVETKGDVTTRTGVFTIANLKGDLAAYRESGIVAFFMDIVDGAKSVTYKVRNEEGAIVDKTVSLETLTDKKVISMAKEVLEAMADEDATLVYESVANRSTTATFVYEVNGEEYAVEYTLSFVYDIEAVKDAEISDAAKALNDEAADFGFAEIKYTAETKTGTFIFSETEKNRDLASYRDSEIVKFFMEIVNGATSVTYKVRNEEGAIVDKTVSLETLTDKKVISMAKEVLEAMADEDVLLTYGSVAGEKSTATFVYEVNGEKISVDYTLEFLMA